MRKFYMACAAALVMAGAGAPALAAKKPQLTPMQIQAMQQKEFEAPKAALFSSVVDVFQDLGYTINSADMASGFITAESATVNKTGFWDAMAEASGSGNTRATAFVEQMPSGMTRVRLNFVNSKTLSSRWGQNSKNDQPILDPAVYQRAYEKVDEALFVRTATNAPKPAPATPPAETAGTVK
jgi:hypothetical protein